MSKYFVVYAVEEEVKINGCVVCTIQKICDNIEYYNSVEELLRNYQHSDYTLVNFWKIEGK